jgi:hypothetical protein
MIRSCLETWLLAVLQLWRCAVVSLLVALILLFAAPDLSHSPQGAQAQPAKSPVGPVYSERPFDETVDALPKQFIGHDLARVIQALIKENEVRRAGKGEFETTEEYNKRLDAVLKRPLFGSVTKSSVVAFQARGNTQLRTKYDADVKELELRLDGQADEGLFVISRLDLRTTTGPYPAANAFGRTVMISKTRGNQYAIAVENASNYRGYEGTPFFPTLTRVAVPMEPEAAKIAKTTLRALLVCTLVEPYLASTIVNHPPTVDIPIDAQGLNINVKANVVAIWFYDPSSGRVLHRERPGVTNADHAGGRGQ